MSDYTNYMRADVSKYVFSFILSGLWVGVVLIAWCGGSWKVFWFSYLGLLVPTVSLHILVARGYT